MEQNGRLIGGMPAQTGDDAQLQTALDQMLKQTTLGSAPALGILSQLQQRRAARLDAAAKGLGRELGMDHPDVIAIQKTAQSVEQLNAKINTQSAQLKSWPRTHANEWLVFGTVVTADDKPAAGFTVRVYDRDRKYDDLLGETETDANGAFSVVYHERDFKESNENLPELYVMVKDAKGTQVYSSRDNVRFNAGQSEYFAIRLGQQPTRSGTTKSTSHPRASASKE